MNSHSLRAVSVALRVLITVCLWSGTVTARSGDIFYTLKMPQPSNHRLEVTIAIGDLSRSEEEVTFILPAWRTGRYSVFDFASGVQRFSARDEAGVALPWKKTDKQSWTVKTNGRGAVVVEYVVYADEFRDRTRDLNDQHAFVDGAAVFMYVRSHENRRVTLDVVPFPGWHVTTGLEAVAGHKNRFRAPDYQVFADCPLEVGTQIDLPFEAEGTPHQLMIAGNGNFDGPRIIEDLKRIIRINKEFWGSLPYKRYVFMVHCAPNAGGATEHLNSTIMHAQPFVFRNPGSYRGFLGLVAHEYFHTWNVKQIRPAAIHRYDFTKEAYAREYWIAEGTTSYYGPLLMLRAGYGSAASYLDGIAASVQQDRLRPGNRVQSLSEASFDAWIKYSRRNPDAYNAEIDFYDKGADISQILDLEIRHRSGNARSLDDVMRTLFKQFRPDTKGYTIEDFERIAEEKAGGSLREFFDNYVHGTVPVPWERFYEHAGIRILPRDELPTAWIGLIASDQGERTVVTTIVAGSPAEQAGVSVRDELLALNGHRVGAAELSRRLSELSVGDSVRLDVFRNDQLRELRCVLSLSPVPAYRAVKVEQPTPLQRAIYEAWLGTAWEK